MRTLAVRDAEPATDCCHRFQPNLQRTYSGGSHTTLESATWAEHLKDVENEIGRASE